MFYYDTSSYEIYYLDININYVLIVILGVLIVANVVAHTEVEVIKKEITLKAPPKEIEKRAKGAGRGVHMSAALEEGASALLIVVLEIDHSVQDRDHQSVKGGMITEIGGLKVGEGLALEEVIVVQEIFMITEMTKTENIVMKTRFSFCHNSTSEFF